MDDLESKIRKYSAANPNVRLKISRRSSSDDYSARDINVETENASDSIKYHLVLYDFNRATKLDLEEIYDETHHKGGNDINDPAVAKLYAGFEEKFLSKLEKDQNIKLKSGLFNSKWW
ncbi:MAG TPA: hypothetical protein VHE59_05225 [Mucilaginibacter sp.]|nr:hypothetical protein [Mucilaginibacter sp.]